MPLMLRVWECLAPPLQVPPLLQQAQLLHLSLVGAPLLQQPPPLLLAVVEEVPRPRGAQLALQVCRLLFVTALALAPLLPVSPLHVVPVRLL